MFTIQLFLRKHWGEVEELPPDQQYAPIGDEEAMRQLFALAPDSQYHYGAVVFNMDGQPWLTEACELDYFLSTIQFGYAAIFSGITHRVDNGYFALDYWWHDRYLHIGQGQRRLQVARPEFEAAFRQAAEQYYQLLGQRHQSPEPYQDLLALLREQWPSASSA
ncbi:MAG: hypothetical protein MUC97_10085 [Bernardetiaceae bacterium]|jgi:hypothetical protein|nr:hypothetical protein [Bernardetiaceae bacterium]